MPSRSDVTQGRPPGSLREGLRESVPLLLTALIFIAVGLVAGKLGMTVGTARFPLSVILVVLGFTAGIGATLSWFFAGASASPSQVIPPMDTPTERECEVKADGDGRPRPTVGAQPATPSPIRTMEPAPWDEGPSEELPVPRPARYPTLAVNVEAQDAIRQLERIEQDVGRRRRARDSKPQS